MKRYSSKEPLVFVWIIIPYIVFMNLLIYGSCIFNTAGIFIKGFIYSSAYFFIIYAIFGTVAVYIHNRYPAAGELFKRITRMLPVFYLLNIAALYAAFYLFEQFNLIACKPIPSMLWYTILYGCIMSTVITFINEGLANWEKWKESLAESEKLKNSYQKSKLLGLKGQINPHFLFNCFNTLSGLIQDNETEAERFLDEMTKVHRYLLRSDDEYLVRLDDEMKFAGSYLYLIKARFGEAINYKINLSADTLQKLIPPLSMQVILENIIYTNALNKKEPLQIQIAEDSTDHLVIQHNIREKVIVSQLAVDEGLENLRIKFRLLNANPVDIIEDDMHRTLVLPLFHQQVSLQ